MKTCFACQASIPDEYQYCLNCGSFFDEPAAALKDEPPPTIPYQGRLTSPQPTTARPSRLPWLIVVVFAATILVLVLIIGLQRGRKSENGTATEVSPTPSPQQLNAEAPLPAAVTEPPTAVTRPGSSSKPKDQSSVSNANSSSTADPNRVYTAREVSEKARLTYKPQPSYSEEARQNQIQGTVVLRIVFAASGKVENIRVVSGLPFGLTERAIDAAKRIQFIPATKDGVPVSMWMQLEYNFNLY